MSLVRLEDVSVAYADAPALSGVDLDISPGEIVTVIGPNGSGKSTLIRTVLGVLAPTSGRVTRAKGLRIGYVPQKLALDASLPLSVERFLNLPDRHPRADLTEAMRRAGVDGLGARALRDLSGGQFQRVLLARAILGRPDLLILDEATQGLDAPGVAGFYKLVEQIRDETGAAVLMVSHDLHVVMSATDRVICLHGHICCEGTPDAVLAAPEYRALFGPGAEATLALYQHHHDHHHDHTHD